MAPANALAESRRIPMPSPDRKTLSMIKSLSKSSFQFFHHAETYLNSASVRLEALGWILSCESALYGISFIPNLLLSHI